MRYLIIIVIILLIVFIYALLKVAGNADKQSEKMQKREELNKKDNNT